MIIPHTESARDYQMDPDRHTPIDRLATPAPRRPLNYVQRWSPEMGFRVFHKDDPALAEFDARRAAK